LLQGREGRKGYGVGKGEGRKIGRRKEERKRQGRVNLFP